jgi:hypothetical protein
MSWWGKGDGENSSSMIEHYVSQNRSLMQDHLNGAGCGRRIIDPNLRNVVETGHGSNDRFVPRSRNSRTDGTSKWRGQLWVKIAIAALVGFRSASAVPQSVDGQFVPKETLAQG